MIEAHHLIQLIFKLYDIRVSMLVSCEELKKFKGMEKVECILWTSFVHVQHSRICAS